MEAKFSFVYETEQEAEAVVKAVSPDNVKAPLGLSIEMVVKDCSLLAVVCCAKPVRSFIATLDDLLACISVAEKTFEAAKALKL